MFAVLVELQREIVLLVCLCLVTAGTAAISAQVICDLHVNNQRDSELTGSSYQVPNCRYYGSKSLPSNPRSQSSGERKYSKNRRDGDS